MVSMITTGLAKFTLKNKSKIYLNYRIICLERDFKEQFKNKS